MKAVTTRSSRTTEPAAELRRVEKAFAGKMALAGLDLALFRHEFLALLGPNGAGKTTALSLLLGLRKPDRGEALLLGGSPRDEDIRRRIGATPQTSAFPPGLRVREIVAFVSAHYSDPVPESELYERFDLGALAGRQVGGLSGGEQRRLGTALALLGNPEVVFLDEPSTGLDVDSRRLLWMTLRSFHRRGGTVLLTTHYLEEAEALAKRVAVINHGRLVAEGTPEEITGRIGLRRVRFRAAAVPDIEPVARSVFEEGVVTIYTPDSDLLVHRLVEARCGFSELEVLPARLEEAFIVYLGLAFGGGLFVSPRLFPGVLEAMSQCLVSRHIAELAWSAAANEPGPTASWFWLAGYTIVGFLLAGWGYRRDEGKRYR